MPLFPQLFKYEKFKIETEYKDTRKGHNTIPYCKFKKTVLFKEGELIINGTSILGEYNI